MKKAILLLIPFLFLIIALLTIGDYNVNWDEPEHFMRGQAYVRYILTGQKNYTFLSTPRRSIYQSDSLNGEYFLQNDYGHPPLNGILASVSNIIFYQKLGWVGDIEAYHLFIILLSTLLIYIVGLWATQEYGLLAGIVASCVLALSPLFIAESHNNIKDPVETALFTLAIYTLYRALTKRRLSWLVASAIFAGMAFGTKFNVIFLPLIVLPWVILQSPRILKLPGAFWITFLLYPAITLGIFYASWPRLWGNLAPLFKTLTYYKDIGTGSTGPNLYALQWIVYTTPPVVLLLVGLGIAGVFWTRKQSHNKPSVLWLLWLFIPVLRVSLPGTSIYGGTRQIMEYLPALALLAGLGAVQLIRFHIPERLIVIVLVLFFIPTVLRLIALHPNENLYFNWIRGGLPGAAARNFPGWGTTLGNPYLQGVVWLNNNAENNATVVITLGVMTNIPAIKFRPDITYANNLESLTERKGEYIMGLTYQAFPAPYYDAIYPERYLVPVKEIKAEGVTILKIWKNDQQHTKPGFINETDIPFKARENVLKGQAVFEFDGAHYVTGLSIVYDPSGCTNPRDGYVYTSLDGISWRREPEGLFANQIPNISKNIADGRIVHLLPAVPAQFVKLDTGTSDCQLNRLGVRIRGLSDILP